MSFPSFRYQQKSKTILSLCFIFIHVSVSTITVPPYLDPEFTFNGDVKVVENRTVYLDCPMQGIPSPDMIWMKDRQPVLEAPFRVSVEKMIIGKNLIFFFSLRGLNI